DRARSLIGSHAAPLVRRRPSLRGRPPSSCTPSAGRSRFPDRGPRWHCERVTDSAPPRGPQPDAGTERAALGGRDDAESPHEDLADHRAEADEPAREQRPAREGSLLRETASIVVSALVRSILIKTSLVQAFFIPSASMEDTLVEGDRVMVSRLVPGAFDVHRGDVVVFKDPGGWLPPPAPQDES